MNCRLFFTRHPTTDDPISIKEGELGYYQIFNNGKSVWNCTHRWCMSIDEQLAANNALFNNTEKDIEIAIACSMFGWDIPMASDFSQQSRAGRGPAFPC